MLSGSRYLIKVNVFGYRGHRVHAAESGGKNTAPADSQPVSGLVSTEHEPALSSKKKK